MHSGHLMGFIQGFCSSSGVQAGVPVMISVRVPFMGFVILWDGKGISPLLFLRVTNGSFRK